MLENYTHNEGIRVQAVRITQENIEEVAKLAKGHVQQFGDNQLITFDETPTVDGGGIGDWAVFNRRGDRFIEAFFDDHFHLAFAKID